MSLLDINMDDIPDLKLLDDGDEVTLQIRKVQEVPVRSDPGRRQLKITLDDPTDELVDDMITYLPILEAADKEADPKSYAKAAGRWKDFCKCFGVNTDGGIDTDSLPGLEGSCIIGIEDDPQYKRKNVVRAFVTGK